MAQNIDIDKATAVEEKYDGSKIHVLEGLEYSD